MAADLVPGLGDPRQVGAIGDRSYSAILRDAMTTDAQKGAYFGTTSGQVAYSNDAGQSWKTLDITLPRVLCARTIVTPAS